MFHHIMVPLDGSERAERALPVAARIARAGNGSILLLRVATPDVTIGGALAPAAESIKAEQEAALSYLREIGQRPELRGVSVSTAVKQDAPVASAILAEAQASACDLIILCSHGRTGLARWALGSTVHKAIHHSPVPILVLRSDGPGTAHPLPDAERPLCALVPLDGSPLAEAALVPAARLAAALSAPAPGILHVFEVLHPDFGGIDFIGERGELMLMDRATHDAIQAEAHRYLSAIAERCKEGELAPPGLHVTWSLHEDRDVAATICQVAESGEQTGDSEGNWHDVICMATHGRSGLQRWVLGSITERVLHAARVPLLIVPPHMAEEPATMRLA
jgi:nucleotide-binding universal stress UspA family protein